MNKYKYICVQTLIFLGQRLFFIRGSIRNILIKIIKYIVDYQVSEDPIKSRIQTSVKGIPFFLYFDGMSDVKQVFGSYNKQEITFIKKNITDNSVFIDIGSNIGFYSQNIASLFPKVKFSKIVAIEPNPILIKRHEDNISLLKKKIKGLDNKIFLENYAIGEFEKDLYLDLNLGYGSARVIENKIKNSINIKMQPLLDILKKNQIERIDCLKIDIEGYEDRALKPFFQNASKNLYPKHMVLEHTSQSEWEDKNFIKFLLSLGYKKINKTRGNLCLSLKIN